jgi:hypothetical protein
MRSMVNCIKAAEHLDSHVSLPAVVTACILGEVGHDRKLQNELPRVCWESSCRSRERPRMNAT